MAVTGSNFISTYTGRSFDLVEPRPEDVEIADVAHALSHEARFNGHTIHHYSVAEHCVLVTRIVSGETGYKKEFKPVLLWALLHDASEAYLKDVPRPLRELLPEYRTIERRVMGAVIERFGMLKTMPEIVREADDEMLKREAANLFRTAPKWAVGMMLNPGPWRPFDPPTAEAQFLKTFERIMSL